ncbi:unnamed protein product [Closterium sp. NIES-64]|nr:unnamed protein product [Closterium sp. NIES-64]
MYALTISVEGECYLRVPPDPGIGTSEVAALCTSASAALGPVALGDSESATPGARESAPARTAYTEALHTFTLDSGASYCFFRDLTVLEQLARPVAVSLADPSGGPVLATSSTVLPCPAVPSGTVSGLYLPSFSTNLVAGSALQDGGVHQFTPAYERVTHCACARTGRHLATFSQLPGLDLYTLTTESPQVAASASASGQLSAPCSCRTLSHQTVLWHHRLGHPSVQRLRGMLSRYLVSGLPRTLPPLPPSPAPPCLPCVEGRQSANHHSSSFPPTEATLQTLHLDVWGPARVRGQGNERYFLLVVNDYTRYTTVFPLCTKGEVLDVLIPWICAARLQLRERFHSDFPVLRLHSDRGGEFSSDLLSAFCAEHGIRQIFTLPASPQQNGVAERRIGLVMEFAPTSMIHAAAPYFLWPFVVQYAAHQLNLWPRVSLPEASPTLHWTGKVGDASVFQVWGCRAFVRDTSAKKLSSRAVPCVFLGFVPNVPGWQFYHPTSRRVFPSQDVTFDESVPFYRLFPYRTAPLPPPPLFLTPGVPLVDPLPPQGPSPSGMLSLGVLGLGVLRLGVLRLGVLSLGELRLWVLRLTVLRLVALPLHRSCVSGVLSVTASGVGLLELGVLLELELVVLRVPCRGRGLPPYIGCMSGTLGAAASGAGAPSTGVPPAGGPGAARGAGASGPGGARTGGTGAAGTGGSSGAGAGAGTAGGAAGAGAAGGTAGGAAGAGAAGGAAGAGAAGGAAGAGATARVGAGGTGAAGVLAGDTGAEGAGAVSAGSPYAGPTRGLTERREPESRPASPESSPESPDRVVRTGRRVPLSSCVLSSLPNSPDPEFDSLRAASPTVMRLLATVVTDPSFESTPASALVAELVDFAAHCRLDYAASLVADSESICPPSVGGESALGKDVLEDRQKEFKCFAAALPHLVSMLITPEGDPDAPDIPTLRSYAEAIEGPYSSQWHGMWIFKVKQPPGSPPVFKAHYVARGFRQREGVDFFQTFSPTPKMTTLRVLLHVAAQRDYELHSLDFSTAFLQGSLHEEIWLRRPPGFTGSFPAGTQWSLRRPVYGLRRAPREWYDTLRTTLAALGFAPSTVDPSLFLHTVTTLPPFYVLVYVDDLVFATADTEALAHVKSELQKRHTCTDLG